MAESPNWSMAAATAPEALQAKPESAAIKADEQSADSLLNPTLEVTAQAFPAPEALSHQRYS